ncbi:permease [uncultured Sneathiella sp.]|uniref:permease n=1 Tax=uncultured Sneathiella sp. TaxID=879315 RepID=UPI0030ECB60F|tara:strand:- start:134479 stop:135531 length:1053 start_codon:yes stop_codon:yes gene_type:complete
MSLNEALQSLTHTRSRLWALLSDRVILACLAIILLLALVDPANLPVSLTFFADAVLGMAPFFALAIGLAAYFSATGADNLIARAFSGSPVSAIVAASLVGALSPFCSCGVIPLVASLLAAGVPLAPVMAFWIASPIMDPEIFVLTSVGIGFGFASGKAVIAMLLGLFAGFSVYMLQQRGWVLDPLKGELSGCRKKISLTGPVDVQWKFWREPARVSQFRSAAASNGWLIGRWLLLAFLIESLMVIYIPTSLIEGLVGQDSLLAIPLAVLIGIPSYLNGYAAIPLVGGLIDLGMSQGAAMAFMTAGGISSIPAAIAVYGLVKKPVFALYLALGISGSMATGIGWQLFSEFF